MPHIIVEYSGNLDNALDVPGLLNALHQAMIETGVADTAAIRTRAIRLEHFCIADRDPNNGFVQITVRMREGRPKEAYQKVGESLMAAAESNLSGDQGVTAWSASRTLSGDKRSFVCRRNLT